jgi:shikimate dehydrogenase
MAETGYLLAGVMGHPVLHSRSPAIHRHWMARHGIRGDYVLLDVRPENLARALRALPALGFAGCNLTIPHKEAAVAAMDGVDPLVTRMGAMNCVAVGPDGRLHGMNNDAFGYLESIREAVPGWRADAGPVAVLGAGGGARAIVHALADAGARDIRIANRDRARADRLAAEVGMAATALDWGDRAEALPGAAMLVNCTSMGMHGQPALDIALDRLPRDAIVSDIVYVPLETPLLAAARLRGNLCVDGLGMLLHQARPAFHAWTGVMPEVTPELRAMVAATIR